MSTITDLIEKLEDELGIITQRLFVLEAFAGEFNRTTRGKSFRIWGSAVWMMILDSRDAHVTHFASWLKSVYGKGGFFGQLTAHHPRAFPRKWRPRSSASHSPEFATILKKQHDESFARLFPDATTAFPSPDDVEKMRQRFVARIEQVVADRDSNRAHPYEEAGSVASSTKLLEFSELRALTTFVEDWLNALRLLSTSSSFVHSDMNFQSPTELAEELVDSVLVGSRSRANLVMGGTDREVYYDDLHTRHAAIGSPDEPLFNDYIPDDLEE